MSFIVDILVALLFINSGVLVLLILAQPPKKDSGGALAFGGGAADALFGAGSGNALTKITKWATVVFVVLAVILGSLETRSSRGNQSSFENGVEQQQQMQTAPRVAPQPATAPASAPAATPAMPVYPATKGK
ncbi:MAG: preprotein translocase subunit SecG [Limisphaerales bacterium]